MAEYRHDEEEENKAQAGPSAKFKDFDCPVCNANNPVDDGFGEGSEIRCYYCGAEFEVRLADSGKPKFREI